MLIMTLSQKNKPRGEVCSKMPNYRNFFIGKARMLTKKGKSERIWGEENSMKTFIAIQGSPYIAVFI